MSKSNFVHILMKNYLTKYLQGSKFEKGKILDELEFQTKFNRKSLIRSFRKLQFTYGPPKRGGSKSTYHPHIFGVLELVWEANDYICAERLTNVLSDTVTELIKGGYLHAYAIQAITQVSSMPLGTLKLKLKQLPRPAGLMVKHKSGKSDLRKLIPINTKQGSAVVCGHLEMDFVDHNGGDSSGSFARSFSLEDVKTQWHNKYAVLGKTILATSRDCC